MRFRSLILAFAFFLEESFATTLDETILLARRNSDQIAIQELNIDLSKAEIAHSLQKFLPSAKYNMQRGTGTVTGLSATGFGSDRDYKVKNDTLTVNFDLSLHQIIAKQVSSWQDFQSAKAKYRGFINSFTIDIVQNYIDIIIATESLELTKVMEKDIGAQKYTSQVKSITESINNIEYLGIESKYDDITSRVIQAEIALEQLKDTYRIFTKRDPSNLQLPSVFKLPAPNLAKYQEMVRANNTDLESMKAQITSISAAKTASYLDLIMPRISYIHQDAKSIIAFLPGAPIIRQKTDLLNLDFGIYENGDKVNQVIQASIQSRILEHQKALLADKLELSSKMYWANHHSLLLLYKSKKEALDIANVQLGIAKERFKKGSSSFISLIQSRVSFYNAKIDYLRAYREFVLNYYKMLSLI
ncbi:TolC family protein [Candidatus Deianiraea vastatrix]|uniref:TolC membrane protein n=1 Tax=Candidatus Deianiraea vastatrix TaxID=2163644 RepID=A0A5B8XE60_9RICK|nr:TolC family protein [Candidatus Deianiraea vastatrix]QED23602.1 Putative TolC membrane protein [Candidatus Deianiraea vastatrix]